MPYSIDAFERFYGAKFQFKCMDNSLNTIQGSVDKFATNKLTNIHIFEKKHVHSTPKL